MGPERIPRIMVEVEVVGPEGDRWLDRVRDDVERRCLD